MVVFRLRNDLRWGSGFGLGDELGWVIVVVWVVVRLGKGSGNVGDGSGESLFG